MAIDNSKELYVDINLNTQAIEKQTQVVINAFGEISKQIANISTQLTNMGNAFSPVVNKLTSQAKQVANAFAYWQDNKKLDTSTYFQSMVKGDQAVFNQTKRNVAVQQELDSELYRQERTIKILNDEKRKQIDNEIKIEQGIKKVKDETKKIDDQNKKVTKSTNTWYKSLAKIGLTVAGFKRLGQTIGELVKESGSWIENLNLFEVTFGDTYQKSLDWAVDFSKQLGFSVNEMVKFTGLFKQLSTSIGIAQETGDKLAETLTSIGTDITSFYNLADVQTAMEKLQAGIFSGQTKPLIISGTTKRLIVKKLCEPTNVGCEQYKIAC